MRNELALPRSTTANGLTPCEHSMEGLFAPRLAAIMGRRSSKQLCCQRGRVDATRRIGSADRVVGGRGCLAGKARRFRSDRRPAAGPAASLGRVRAPSLPVLHRALPGSAVRPDPSAGVGSAARGHQAGTDGALRRLGDRSGCHPSDCGGVRRELGQPRPGFPRPVRGVHDLWIHRRAGVAGARSAAPSPS